MIIIAISESLRPKQWIKNLFIFAALAFSRNFTNTLSLSKTIEAFVIFCLLSSACYIFNDILDAKTDRLHPVKSKRPIASGRLPFRSAIIIAIVLLVISLTWATSISLRCKTELSVGFFYVALSYALLQILYSLALKKAIILDALAIATGFILRMVAGAAVINIAISKWLYICTISLSLFIAFCKRRAEMNALETPESHRLVLGQYSPYMLDQMISALTALTIMAYTLYTLADETVAKLGSQNMLLTIPFVVYGIFRYLYLVHQKQQGGEPENIILADKPLLINILLWAMIVVIILY
jgi:4-hydroxybenzoate polyprenyltransferase